MSATIALKNTHGSTEANVNCVSYQSDPDGVFHVPEDVALQLLALPAGFALADDEPQPLETTMTRDFLAPRSERQPAATRANRRWQRRTIRS